MKLGLPQLAIRVKHGIPFRASPYINVVGTEGILPRSTVNALFKEIPDPFSLLNESNELEVRQRIKSCLDAIAGNLRNESDVMRVVRTAYRDYLEQFLLQLVSNDVQVLLGNLRGALSPANPNQLAFGNSWKCSRLLDCLTHDLPANDEPGERDVPLDFECLHASEEQRDSTVYLLNWHEKSPHALWSITPCGFVLLLLLVKRRLLKWSQVSGKLSEMQPSRIDVYWIASHVWDRSEALSDKTSLRESMLALIEPVGVLA